MVQPLPEGYVFDPADPRAPTHAQWAAMSEPDRARVVDMLPTSLPVELAPPPEGDVHRKVKERAMSALGDFLRRAGRKIYLSSELIVLYPGERAFVPDLLAVLDVGHPAARPRAGGDVDPHDRVRWVVDAEGKGLDLVLEVHVAGDRTKDEKTNVERYARLGIREYFLFDRARMSLQGHRLAAGGRTY